MPRNRSYNLVDDRFDVDIMAKGQIWPVRSNTAANSSNSRALASSPTEQVAPSNGHHSRRTFENLAMEELHSDNSAPYSGPSAYRSSSARARLDGTKSRSKASDRTPVLTAYDDELWEKEIESNCCNSKGLRWSCAMICSILVLGALAVGIYYAIATSTEKTHGHISHILITMKDKGMQWDDDLADPSSNKYNETQAYYRTNITKTFTEAGFDAVIIVVAFEKDNVRVRRSVMVGNAFVRVIFEARFNSKMPKTVDDVSSILKERNPNWTVSEFKLMTIATATVGSTSGSSTTTASTTSISNESGPSTISDSQTSTEQLATPTETASSASIVVSTRTSEISSTSTEITTTGGAVSTSSSSVTTSSTTATLVETSTDSSTFSTTEPFDLRPSPKAEPSLSISNTPSIDLRTVTSASATAATPSSRVDTTSAGQAGGRSSTSEAELSTSSKPEKTSPSTASETATAAAAAVTTASAESLLGVTTADSRILGGQEITSSISTATTTPDTAATDATATASVRSARSAPTSVTANETSSVSSTATQSTDSTEAREAISFGTTVSSNIIYATSPTASSSGTNMVHEVPVTSSVSTTMVRTSASVVLLADEESTGSAETSFASSSSSSSGLEISPASWQPTSNTDFALRSTESLSATTAAATISTTAAGVASSSESTNHDGFTEVIIADTSSISDHSGESEPGSGESLLSPA